MVTVHPLLPGSFPVSSSAFRVRRTVAPAGTVISTWLPVTKPSVSPLGSAPAPVTRRLPAKREPVWVTVISICPLPPAGWFVLTHVPCHLPVISMVAGGCVLAHPPPTPTIATPITTRHHPDTA